MEKIQFAVEDYRAITSGALKGAFTLVLQPGSLEIRNCKHFVGNNGSEWFSLPQKETKNEQSGKTTYFPLNKFKNLDYWQHLQKQVLEHINSKPRPENGKDTNLVQGDAQPVWF